jgi:hypothetical protein
MKTDLNETLEELRTWWRVWTGRFGVRTSLEFVCETLTLSPLPVGPHLPTHPKIVGLIPLRD